MNALEIIAAVFSAWIIIKLGILWAVPKKFGKWGVNQWMHNVASFKTLALVLTVIVGYFVFTTLDIVTIAAVMAFTALLYKFTLMSYTKEMTHLAKELMQKPQLLLSRAWIALIIWICIALWTLWALFV